MAKSTLQEDLNSVGSEMVRYFLESGAETVYILLKLCGGCLYFVPGTAIHDSLLEKAMPKDVSQ